MSDQIRDLSSEEKETVAGMCKILMEEVGDYVDGKLKSCENFLQVSLMLEALIKAFVSSIGIVEAQYLGQLKGLLEWDDQKIEDKRQELAEQALKHIGERVDEYLPGFTDVYEDTRKMAQATMGKA